MTAVDNAAELIKLASVCDMLGLDPVSLRWANYGGVNIQFRTPNEVDILANHLGLPKENNASGSNYTRGDYLGPVSIFGPRSPSRTPGWSGKSPNLTSSCHVLSPKRPTLRTVGNWSHIADALWTEGVSP